MLWFFRNRQTGAITVAQAPNVVLWIAIVSAGVKWIWSPEGVLGTTLGMVVTSSLLLWAADEIARGVNPWRRFLGLAVGAYEVAGMVARSFNVGHG